MFRDVDYPCLIIIDDKELTYSSQSETACKTINKECCYETLSVIKQK